MPPYQIVVLRNVINTGTPKLPSQNFGPCKSVTPHKTSPIGEVRIKTGKKLSESLATLRYNNNALVKCTFDGTEFCMVPVEIQIVNYISERTLKLC